MIKKNLPTILNKTKTSTKATVEKQNTTTNGTNSHC